MYPCGSGLQQNSMFLPRPQRAMAPIMLNLAAQPWLEQEPAVLIFWKKALLITLGILC